ncbi:MAG: ATP-dependent chaperone ClpB, partial [Prochloron sp. SP5CPC1]|nr:ATP-dependent chaperone ClpB [Candidatus Paraprochloron terpiosi SP5CPC1]
MQPTDPSKFTELAWEAIVKSQEVARRYKNQDLDVEHVMLSLLEEGLAQTLLESAKIDPARLQVLLTTFAKRQPKVNNTEQLYLGPSLDMMLDRAEACRESWQDKFISTEHLLVGFAEDDRIGRRCLRNFNLDPQDLEKTIKENRTEQITEENLANTDSNNSSVLEKYGRDLTAQASLGKLDPVIGRDEEIRRLIQVLSRRSKNNPVLIGEPGVGKT